MKITKARLKEIIKEELEREMAEDNRPPGLGLDYDPNVRAGEQGPEAVVAKERMKELASRLHSLTPEEAAELEALITDI
jgi:hypothetical protein